VDRRTDRYDEANSGFSQFREKASMKLEFSWTIFKIYSNFMKIRPAGAELFHVDRRTDRHDEANSGFSQFREKA
jgi:hypothetical protein